MILTCDHSEKVDTMLYPTEEMRRRLQDLVKKAMEVMVLHYTHHTQTHL